MIHGIGIPIWLNGIFSFYISRGTGITSSHCFSLVYINHLINDISKTKMLLNIFVMLCLSVIYNMYILQVYELLTVQFVSDICIQLLFVV